MLLFFKHWSWIFLNWFIQMNWFLFGVGFRCFIRMNWLSFIMV